MSLTDRLNKASKGNNFPQYKRVFIQGKGKEYNLRFLSTALVDPDDTPFVIKYIHSGHFHPNYQSEYPSKFACLGGKSAGCPWRSHRSH